MTLVEILVVLAIIALLAGSLYPVFATAKRRASETDCLARMRQLGLAFQAYLEDYGEPLGRPLALEYLYPHYVNDLRLFVCPADSLCEQTGWLGFDRRSLPGNFSAPPFAISYYDHPLYWSDSLWQILWQRAEGAGWLVCRLHGDKLAPPSACYAHAYSGLHLRLLLDGSVRRLVRARTEPVYAENGWQIATDEPEWPRDADRHYRPPYGSPR